MNTKVDDDVEFTCILNMSQACALAQMCKRLSWHDAMKLAVDESEGRHILNATDRVRGALEQAGIYVR